jgi:hypothetical protein
MRRVWRPPSAAQLPSRSGPACLGIRLSVGCALIIPMIIQTIGLDPSGAVWTDEALNVSRLDPSGAYWVDAEHPSRNRNVQVNASGRLGACRIQGRSGSIRAAVGRPKDREISPPSAKDRHGATAPPSPSTCGCSRSPPVLRSSRG